MRPVRKIQCFYLYIFFDMNFMTFPDGPVIKSPPANAGDMGSVPGSGRSPGEGNDYPLQYSYTGNPMDRGAWQATVHGPQEVDTTK